MMKREDFFKPRSGGKEKRGNDKNSGSNTGDVEAEEQTDEEQLDDAHLATSVSSTAFRMLSMEKMKNVVPVSSDTELPIKYLEEQLRELFAHELSCDKLELQIKVKKFGDDILVGNVSQRNERESSENKYLKLWHGKSAKAKSVKFESATFIRKNGIGGIICCKTSNLSCKNLKSVTDYNFTRKFAHKHLSAEAEHVSEVKRNCIVGTQTSKVHEIVTGEQLRDFDNMAYWFNSVVESFTTEFKPATKFGDLELDNYCASINATQVRLIGNGNCVLTLKNMIELSCAALDLSDGEPDPWHRFFFFTRVDYDTNTEINECFKTWYNNEVGSWCGPLKTLSPPAKYQFHGVRFGNSWSKQRPEIQEIRLYHLDEDLETIEFRKQLKQSIVHRTEKIKPCKPGHLKVSVGANKQTPLCDWIECAVLSESEKFSGVRISKNFYKLSENYLDEIAKMYQTICSRDSSKVLNDLGLDNMPYPALSATRKLAKQGGNCPSEYENHAFVKELWQKLKEDRKKRIDSKDKIPDKLSFEGIWNELVVNQLCQWSAVYFDKLTTPFQGVELCDIGLKIDETAYLLHVKSGFDAQSVRAVCGQILAASTRIKALIGPSPCIKPTDSWKNANENVRKFVECLQSEQIHTIVFVCVMIPTNKDGTQIFSPPKDQNWRNQPTVVPILNIVQTQQYLESVIAGVQGKEFKFSVYQPKHF